MHELRAIGEMASSEPIGTDDLLNALVDLPQEFEPGELCYLALTSKPEGHIRDRLAWLLSKRGYRVAREWRVRCDLAVLAEDGEPQLIVESKAAYTHDVLWTMKDKHKAIQARVGAAGALDAELRGDAEKMEKLAGPGKGYLVVVSMHRPDAVPPTQQELIAEGKRLPKDRQAAEATLLRYLAPLGPVSPRVTLAEGRHFGIGMEVCAWLCGPVHPLAQWGALPAATGTT